MAAKQRQFPYQIAQFLEFKVEKSSISYHNLLLILSILCPKCIFRDTCLHAENSLAVTFQGSEKQPIPCISHADGAVIGAHYQQLACSFLSCG